LVTEVAGVFGVGRRRRILMAKKKKKNEEEEEERRRRRRMKKKKNEEERTQRKGTKLLVYRGRKCQVRRRPSAPCASPPCAPTQPPQPFPLSS
jgi:hypothetical protein